MSPPLYLRGSKPSRVMNLTLDYRFRDGREL